MSGIQLPHFRTGKVGETFRLPDYNDLLLLERTDRFSTHNLSHKTGIPGKGELLTAQTVFWVQTFPEIKTHVVAAGSEIEAFLPKGVYTPSLANRAIVVRRRKPILREFIYRNYLTGSLKRALEQGSDPYGNGLALDLPRMHRFPKPLFTPTMKSKDDEPVSARETAKEFPSATRLTRKFFCLLGAYLDAADVVLIDGKMEADEEMLLDEFGTGDTCRMARKSDLREGEDPPFLDKEIMRKMAEAMWGDGPKVPLAFTDSQIAEGIRSYHQAFELITESSLADFQKQRLAYRDPSYV